jgi:TetR/AcrR family transcriptional repressor of nem operon
MRVTREKAAENRSKVIDVAGKLFRERGFNGVGVADIMKAAELTHGGFYGQFDSKEDLAVEACKAVHARSAARWREIVVTEPKQLLPILLDRYLSTVHRDAPENGCAFATLAVDASRQGKAVKEAFADGLRPLIDILAASFPEGTKAQRRRKALSAMAQLVGAMALSRAVDDAALSDDILSAARKEILASAGL